MRNDVMGIRYPCHLAVTLQVPLKHLTVLSDCVGEKTEAKGCNRSRGFVGFVGQAPCAYRWTRNVFTVGGKHRALVADCENLLLLQSSFSGVGTSRKLSQRRCRRAPDCRFRSLFQASMAAAIANPSEIATAPVKVAVLSPVGASEARFVASSMTADGLVDCGVSAPPSAVGSSSVDPAGSSPTGG